MSRRRATKRERLERQERLREPRAAGAPEPPRPRERKVAPVGVSYAGAAGALLGFGFNVSLGVAILAGAGEASTPISIPFFLLALVFVPAFLTCVTPSEMRDRVLRATVIGCLLSAIGGTVAFGAQYAFVMALPTVLLAQAAGLIWQGGSKH